MPIPRIIHQMWKDDHLPGRVTGWVDSWKRLHPGWDYRFWTDRSLLDFVREHYPWLLETYVGYRENIMRADAARYMLLHHFGGVYADLDTEPLQPFDSLLDEDRVVVGKEPPAHWPLYAGFRAAPYVLFNGLIAAPPGHPFIGELLERLAPCRHAASVLDVAGPCFLTGVYLGWGAKDGIALHEAGFFAGIGADGRPVPADGETPMARHFWMNSWVRPAHRPRPVVNALLAAAGYARYRLTRGETLDERIVRRSVDSAALRRPPPDGDNLAILVPIRDVEPHVTRLVELIASLEHPKEQTKLVFLEGDSTDETYERLEAALAPLRGAYRDIIVARKHLGTAIKRKERWEPQHQRVRRSAIAKVRNHLIDIGLDASDDWALWIDADMWWFPPDLFAQLLAANARIVVPDCTTLPGGITFDANTWLEFERPPAYRYYRRINRGVYQPFGGGRARERLYLDSLRHTDRVEVDSVGGTVLLVDAALHRGGLRFPEVPYRHHLETEGFGLLARDLGVRPVALPRLEVLHVPIQW